MTDKPTGRKPIEIDMAELERLAEYQCTAQEMAAWFHCSVDTIERRVKEHYGMSFAEFFDAYKGKGKVSLRRKQHQVAMSGDVKMLIHLGKHRLDQVEHQKIESMNTNKNVELSYEEYLKTLEE